MQILDAFTLFTYQNDVILMQRIQEIAQQLMTHGKGILAADESISSADKRLRAVDVEPSEEMRRQYRELFLNTDGIENYLNGVILYDETMYQKSDSDEFFPALLEKKGVLPGIKVDGGTTDFPKFPGELITEGLDGLKSRLVKYYELGARFTKWRAVIKIGEGIPTDQAIRANAHALGLYATIVQEQNMVPIVEPEVLMDGTHTLEKSEEVLTRTLKITFQELMKYRVDVTGLILKSSFAHPGKESEEKVTPHDVAHATIRAIKASVPHNLAGVVFLSGGESPMEAALDLNAIAEHEPLPWLITFSYARAIQGPALEIWKGKPENIGKAREVYIEWLKKDVAADLGKL